MNPSYVTAAAGTGPVGGPWLQGVALAGLAAAERGAQGVGVAGERGHVCCAELLAGLVNAQTGTKLSSSNVALLTGDARALFATLGC